MHDSKQLPQVAGRGSSLRPKNRFERMVMEVDWGELREDEWLDLDHKKIPTEYFVDQSNSIVSENNSPDLNFDYSLNPYRGCAHGCSYCYARPSHEYLGFDAGLDFESKIMVKPDAAKLLRRWLSRPSWKPSPIMLSGVTDCYQPVERQLGLTRECLQVALEFRQPIRLITKNALVRRDIDILSEMARLRLAYVSISVTSLDQSLTKTMEPRCSSPQARIETIGALCEAGIPVHVSVAPIIPGLNDSEMPSILKAASQAGARSASFIVIRLPQNVEPVFLDWLERHRPLESNKILSRIRSLRDGKLNSNEFGKRMRGQGIFADQLRQMFKTFCHKYGLNEEKVELERGLFRVPDQSGIQQKLF